MTAKGDEPKGPTGKAIGRNPVGGRREKSDEGIVLMNSLKAHAEEGEGRPEAEGNSCQLTMSEAQNSALMSGGLSRIRAVAAKDSKARFTSLLHHVTPDLLRDAFEALKRYAAPGVDDVTWHAYGENLRPNLHDLHARVHSGTYRAQPSKRAWILKPDGRRRPLGIAALEDKIIQKAVVWVLEAIYEQDFARFSYGFRPGRSQHDALDALWVGITRKKVGWILDADIQSFFDTLDHEWLMKFVEHRVADPRILRLIRKWLKAGVNEDGQWLKTTIGTPQGAVISPLLANIYLHYVFDLWVQWWRKHRATGDVIVVRYADDTAMGFQHRNEAELFLHDLHERLAQFGLKLHPDKTRLIEFGRFAQANRSKRGDGPPDTFNFLGFQHRCGTRRKDGGFTVDRETIGKRLTATVKRVRQELLKRRHEPTPQVGKWLKSVVTGYFNYHAVPGNTRALWLFRYLISKDWRRALSRRSQRAWIRWDRMAKLINAWLPRPKVIHPYPNQRLIV
jgi:group II intron reverse transcriptase/maturase